MMKKEKKGDSELGELGTFPKGTPQGYKQSLFLYEIATLCSQ